jgi:hypothetical protein
MFSVSFRQRDCRCRECLALVAQSYKVRVATVWSLKNIAAPLIRAGAAWRQSETDAIIACFHTTFTVAIENDPTTHSDGSETMQKWLLFANLCACLLPTNALAWWDEGHKQIAAVAYARLTPAVRAKVDLLIKLNPEYANWVGSYPARRAAQYAFVRAAVWADDIKTPAMGHTEKGDKPTTPEAGQNIGYYDNLMHKYWHFKDIGFSTDGTPLEDADPVNALTQIKALTAGLAPSSGLPDDVRSYDLVWLLHLVCDAHQPLHATARFSHDLPHGDQGGNKGMVVPATGEKIALHAYWDRRLGSYSTPEGAIQDALISDDTKLPDPDPTLAMKANPDDWFTESEKLAEANAYAEAVKSGTQSYVLDRQYETNARNMARQQAASAGARLANLNNEALKLKEEGASRSAC